MPDMTLTRDEARSIAAWLLSTGTAPHAGVASESGNVARGRQYFIDLNCGACHALNNVPVGA